MKRKRGQMKAPSSRSGPVDGSLLSRSATGLSMGSGGACGRSSRRRLAEQCRSGSPWHFASSRRAVIVPMQRESLGGLLERFPALLRAKGRAESTIDSYVSAIKTYVTPEIGTIPLTKLTQVDLNNFMQRKLASGLSARTVQYAHAIIRSALTRAERDGLVSRNVAKLATPPDQDHTSKVVPLSAEDARRFLVAVQGHRLEALYAVALAIGLRRGEALGLAWDAVDLENGTLAVTQTAARIKGKGIVLRRAAKTDKSLRMIPLSSFAARKLTRHRELQEEEGRFAGEQWREHGLVFASTIGTPLEPTTLRRHFHATLKLLGIDRRRFHDLRHTAASLLLAQGATLHEVKEILGHSQIRLTSDLYGHAYMSVKREALSRMDAVLEAQSDRVAPSVAPSVTITTVN